MKEIRPTSVSILGKEFEIRYMEKVDSDDSSGECCSDEQIIKIRNKHPFEGIRDTLLHEVIHAVEESLLLKMNEKQVHALAVGLLQVFRANEHFVKFLTEKKKRGK